MNAGTIEIPRGAVAIFVRPPISRGCADQVQAAIDSDFIITTPIKP
jgi:hypothetical protein